MIQTDLLQPALLIVIVIILFYIYYYTAHSRWLKRSIGSTEHTSWLHLRLFMIQKLLGVLFLGISSALLYLALVSNDFGKFGIGVQHIVQNGDVLIIVLPVIVLLVYINQKMNPDNNSLQMPYRSWNLLLVSVNALGWILYLLAYEFLFRGILLMETAEYFGFLPAIAINIVIYSAIHMVNGITQALGALFFGAIACYFALTRETILIPVLMHVALSLGSDHFSIQINKKLQYVGRKPFSLP